MTPQEARALYDLLDLIDDAHPTPADSLLLKSVLRRLIYIETKEK